jgi:hypothetical protein
VPGRTDYPAWNFALDASSMLQRENDRFRLLAGRSPARVIAERVSVPADNNPLCLRLIFGSNRSLLDEPCRHARSGHLASAMLHRKILIRKTCSGYA